MFTKQASRNGDLSVFLFWSPFATNPRASESIFDKNSVRLRRQYMKYLTLSFVILLTLSTVHRAQTPQVASSIHDFIKINSQILNEERTILVRVPANYRDPSTRFPAIYMLDAHAPQNAMMVGLVEQQAWGGVTPEMIVVGIQNTERTRDLTPTKEGRATVGGGLDRFLEFIEKEVIPLVEKNYRTQPYRVFAGHSYGGLAVVYSMLTRPRIFDAYIAASPTLHYDNDLVIKRAEEAFKQNKEWDKTLFASIGDEPEYVKGFNAFQTLLKKSDLKKLKYDFQVYKDENHGSTVLRSYYAGLRKVFDSWAPPAEISVTSLENHYESLSKRFGYKIAVPEALQNRAAYSLLRANQIDEAIRYFKKNVENYPNSANTYDSLAEAYEKSGQVKQALENYEKAYKMAELRGESQLAVSSKASFARLAAKIK